MLSHSIKHLVKGAVRNPLVWGGIDAVLGPISAIHQRAARLRDPAVQSQQQLYAEVDRKMDPVVADLVVRNGPFAGLRYPNKKATGSAFYPKILGSYESELHGVIATILQTPYDSVVDIGCAEGYYAVGIKRQRPDLHVWAYDIDACSRSLCEQMAELNDVSVRVGAECDGPMLMQADLGDRALILMDCEGYECELITDSVVSRLHHHDFLIESHDFLRIDTTRTLLAAFANTHDCEVLSSVDDLLKAYTYEYAELAGFSLAERKVVLEEYRPTQMRWIMAKARNHQ